MTALGPPSDRAGIEGEFQAAADPDGFLPFDRFVEIALYSERFGYYESAAVRSGRHGDYYTAPETGPLLAATLARRIATEHARLPTGRRFTVAELGPGEAPLVAGLRAPGGLDLGPDVEVEYVLIERSSSRREVSVRAAQVGPLRENESVRGAGSLAELGPFAGVVVGNELLDALPFRRLVRRSEQWTELGVRWTDGHVVWADGGPVSRTIDPPLPDDVPEGTILEIPVGAQSIVREIGDHLIAGAALFLDYGDEEAELLRRFPAGSVAAIRRHHVEDDVLARPGEQDLSAFVNFSRVRRAAERAGLRVAAYDRQAEALGRWGLPDALAAAVRASSGPEAEVRLRLNAKSLSFGFENFRALELSAG